MNKIIEITSLDAGILESVHKFIQQLTSYDSKIESKLIETIINDKAEYVGMFTIGFYISPTGKKAWIEDVVVDDMHRGNGIGKFLMKFAIQFAKGQNAKTLMLTSNPARIIANKLYQNIGFHQKTTNVYLMEL